MVLGVLALALCIAVAVRVSARRGPRPYRVPVAAKDVLGPEQWARVPRGNRFVLVVFLDYCCPACADAVRRAAALVSGQPGRIVLCVRNYPLSVDRRAREVALFVEAAKFQGRSPTSIGTLPDACGRTRAPLRDLARRLGLDWPRLSRDMAGVASRTVAQDERDGRALGIRGTPALFLCCPDGSVYRLRAPEQAERVLPMALLRSQTPPWGATSPGTPRPSGTGEIARCAHA